MHNYRIEVENGELIVVEKDSNLVVYRGTKQAVNNFLNYQENIN
jgi:hypothetical protein